MIATSSACYRSSDAIPADVAAALPAGFVQAFNAGQGFSGLGPRLERTATVLRERFEPPCLLVDRTPAGNYLCFLRFDSGNGSVSAIVADRETIELYPVAELYAALPEVFQSYYRWFEGMQLLKPGEEPSLAWLDLPCAYNGRVELSDLARRASLSSDAVNGLYYRFGSKSLQAWLICSSGDVFFADEFNRRGQLFHFHKRNVAKVSVVDAEGFLDDYLSFVIAGGAFQDFNLGSRLSELPF